VSIDWNVVASALHDSRDGHSLKALAILSGLMSEAESDIDRAAILLGESSCYAQLGNIAKSRELLESAKTYAQGDRVALSQVALAEASIDAQCKDYKLACEKFASVKSEYHDLLIQAEHDDFLIELDSRYACALVDAGEFSAAEPVFRKLFERDELEDRQRLQVYFSVALWRLGHAGEAQSLLFEAAKGHDTALSQTALEYLADIGGSSSRQLS
jgi:tetratricopeptide (TPR) repeat protein